MNSRKANSRENLKMASPRGCVAFSALETFRGVRALLKQLLSPQHMCEQGFEMNAAPGKTS
jgi:hypothetical protein